MSHPDSNSVERATYGHCELSGYEDCPQPLSKAAARCELCTGCLDPVHHPAPTVTDGTITAGEVAFNAHKLTWAGNGLDVGTWEGVLPAGREAWEAAANAVIAGYQHHQVFTEGKYKDHGVEVLLPPHQRW